MKRKGYNSAASLSNFFSVDFQKHQVGYIIHLHLHLHLLDKLTQFIELGNQPTISMRVIAETIAPCIFIISICPRSWTRLLIEPSGVFLYLGHFLNPFFILKSAHFRLHHEVRLNLPKKLTVFEISLNIQSNDIVPKI